jgi:hypothetical protein
MASPARATTPPGQQNHSATALPQHSAPATAPATAIAPATATATANHPTRPRIQRAVPIHRPAASSVAAPLPLPVAFRAPAAPPPSAGVPIQRSMTDFVSAAANAQARETRARFNGTVDDQVGGFTDKIADIQDTAALVRDPSQFRQVIKQRGIEMFAESHPIAGTLLGQRYAQPEGGFGARGGSGRARGRGEHQEMEQLAEKLVAPLARLLRTELRMDRERMGRLRDSGR